MYNIWIECTLLYNGKCYKAVMDGLTWYAARDNCIALGGRLAEVCEPELNNRLLQVLQPWGRLTHYWKLDLI